MNPVSIAGLALAVFSAFNTLIKSLKTFGRNAASAERTLVDKDDWIQVQLIDLKTWLQYWGIEEANSEADRQEADHRLQCYWGQEGTEAIRTLLETIKANLDQLLELRERYPSTMQNALSTAISGSSTRTSKARLWFNGVSGSLRYAMGDGRRFKLLWDELGERMKLLNQISESWFRRRNPNCMHPKEAEPDPEFLAAARVRQASAWLFKRLKIDIVKEIELVLVMERLSCAQFRSYLPSDIQLRPESVKFLVGIIIKERTSSSSTVILVEAIDDQNIFTDQQVAEFVSWICDASGQQDAVAHCGRLDNFHLLTIERHTESAKCSLRERLKSYRETSRSPDLPVPWRWEFAHLLSLAVFQLHNVWTSDCLSSDNIRIDDASPFGTWLVQSTTACNVNLEAVPFDVCRPRSTPRNTFKLGVVLWEIGCGKSIDYRVNSHGEWLPYQWESNTMDGRKQEIVAEYLLSELGTSMGGNYEEIVTSCLRVDFGCDLTDGEKLLSAFYNTVVKPLKEMVTHLSRPKRRSATRRARGF